MHGVAKEPPSPTAGPPVYTGQNSPPRKGWATVWIICLHKKTAFPANPGLPEIGISTFNRHLLRAKLHHSHWQEILCYSSQQSIMAKRLPLHPSFLATLWGTKPTWICQRSKEETNEALDIWECFLLLCLWCLKTSTLKLRLPVLWLPKLPLRRPEKKKKPVKESYLFLQVRKNHFEKQKVQQLLMHYCVRTAAQHTDRLKLVHAAWQHLLRRKSRVAGVSAKSRHCSNHFQVSLDTLCSDTLT